MGTQRSEEGDLTADEEKDQVIEERLRRIRMAKHSAHTRKSIQEVNQSILRHDRLNNK